MKTKQSQSDKLADLCRLLCVQETTPATEEYSSVGTEEEVRKMWGPEISARAINDALNPNGSYPHLFVFACLMDRQIKAERAWAIPYMVAHWLTGGDLSFSAFAKLGKAQLVKLFQDKGFHRFNQKQAEALYDAICILKEKYGGDARRIWQDPDLRQTPQPSAAAVISRFLEFPCVGIKIASMATNLLHRMFGITYSDYSALDASPDVHLKRVLYRTGLISDQENTDLVINKAREINPSYPGIIDEKCWEIGREYCRPTHPLCTQCELNNYCLKRIE